jgi:hypothetical protein
MANDLDQFPLYDPIIEPGRGFRFSDSWMDAMATFYENLAGYLTQNGILLPNVTSDERDAITTPQLGQMIYNTTLDTAQYYKAGVWTSF